MKNSNKVLSVLCLLTLASCGGDKGGGSSAPSGPVKEEQIQETEGTYKAIMRPYNFNLAGWIPNGITDINIVSNEMEVKSWLDDSADVTHMQNIHIGTTCPGPEHDSNKDGYVDLYESMAVAGKILIPLDSEISAQDGSTEFPKGNFSYFETVNIPAMMDDLQSADTNTGDSMVKLAPTQGLNLAGKVIIIMGSANRMIPDSVSLHNGQPKNLSIPIACGVIERK